MTRWLRAHHDWVVLMAIQLAVLGTALFWAAHEATSTGRKFCAVVEVATEHRVPRPANPRGNPSRENAYIFYLDFVRLRRDLGCQPGRMSP